MSIPAGYKGPVQEPAFYSLMGAYYLGADESDHSIAYPPRVQPGDTILVHAGVYKDARYDYSGFDPNAAAYGTPFDGTYFLTASGTPDKPIVIKSAGDGEVIFDGDGNFNLFNLMAANYNYFDGITVRNTSVAFLLGWKSIAGSSGFTLVHSRAENVGRVVQDEWAGSKDFYIADNVFIGRHDPTRLLAWYYRPQVWSKFPGYPALITSEYAVKVYGQGHVVAYNYVANWHDGIDISTYGTPSSDPDRNPSAIDFYNNDIYNVADNCIEADGGGQNIRVFDNRCVNSAGGALSAQPIFGGPLYFYRNLTFSGTSGGPLKLIDTPSRVADLSEHLHRRGAADGPGRAMSTSATTCSSATTGQEPIFNFSHLHQLFQLRLQRLPAEPGRRRQLRLEFARPRAAARISRKPVLKRPFATLSAVRQGERPGQTQRAGRLQSVPQGEPAGSQRPAAPRQTGRLRFHSGARLGRDRQGSRAAQHHRRLHRPCARSGRVRVRPTPAALRSDQLAGRQCAGRCAAFHYGSAARAAEP